ncbi:2Fe-2S iron-sulfur cluster-binding protein [Sphingobium sp. HBC34]|uniref:2Fe-2S iron-sulfur cluster-binding protein n=1 Tax=Sphingobium cyanobacteriorum TaxID=3063954 RepID=A0ABT8ZQW6_9SPHN|nr:2Fe-2S iron-sulfur cluster-binding protein [Sphingobium sp. HBC34]MDO7836586.1 2Fe-2S iron-sulfur cluster-binding protein [Sphingobium sp. HBC34]
MVRMVFVSHDNNEYPVEVAEGTTLLRAALDNGVPGMTGECGGELACATCHCYLDEGVRAKIDEPGDDEAEMLEGAIDVTADSRLGCQLRATASFDGVRIRLPASQT